jgi:hypothetical protein
LLLLLLLLYWCLNLGPCALLLEPWPQLFALVIFFRECLAFVQGWV